MKLRELRFIVSMFWRSFFLQALWNFERLQNVGFAFTLQPLLTSLYPDKNARTEALLRHLGFFNTHPYMVNIICGLVATMEEDKAEGKTVSVEEIISIKNNMAGPLAAIGDTFFWATWRPFCGIFAVCLILFFFRSRNFLGTWLAPIVFLFIYNVLHIPFRLWSLRISYQLRSKLVDILAELEFQLAVEVVRLAGLVVLILTFAIYMWFFPSNSFERIIYLSMFVLATMLGFLRLSPAIIFYVVILLSVGIIGARSY